MDQKRLFLAIAVSLAILLGFQTLIAPHLPKPAQPEIAQLAPVEHPVATPLEGAPGAAVPPSPVAVPRNVPRVKIQAPRVEGSISLLGARLDDVVLRDYREEIEANSPLVRLLEPRSDNHPYYVQYGWTASSGDNVKLPDNDTVWTASADTLVPGKPVTLSWDNGAGLAFQIGLAVDDEYMFTVTQTVKNTSAQPIKLFPWSRIRRDYKPVVAGYYVLFEGLLGVTDGTLAGNLVRQGQVGGRQEERPGVRGHDHRRLGRHHRQILADLADPRPGRRDPRSTSAISRITATITRWTPSAPTR